MPTRERIVGGLDELRLVVLRLRDLYLVTVVQSSLVVNRVVGQRDITSLMSTFSLLSYDLFDFIVLQLYLLYQLRDQYLFLVLFVIYQLYIGELLVIYQVQIQSTQQENHLEHIVLTIVLVVYQRITRFLREGIYFDIRLSSLVGDLEVIFGQQLGLVHLATCKLLCSHKVLQCFVISQYLNQEVSTLKLQPLFLKTLNDYQQFLVVDLIVILYQNYLLREEGYRV